MLQRKSPPCIARRAFCQSIPAFRALLFLNKTVFFHTMQECRHVAASNLHIWTEAERTVSIVPTLGYPGSRKPKNGALMRRLIIHVRKAWRFSLIKCWLTSQTIQERRHICTCNVSIRAEAIRAVAVGPALRNPLRGEPKNSASMRRAGVHIGERGRSALVKRRFTCKSV